MAKYLYVDLGMTWGHGYRLAKDNQQVYLYVPYHEPYPNWINYAIGYGFLPRVQNIEEVMDEVDYIIFGDIGFGYTIERLRKEGKKVWGAGVAENLEIDRIYSKKIMDKLGIKYPTTYQVTGLSNLYNFLKSHYDKKFCIKPAFFRGDFESYIPENIEDLSTYFSELDKKLGPFKDIFEFIVEEVIDGVMIGIDTWIDGKGKFVRPLFIAFEINMDAVGLFTYTSIFDDYLDKLEGFLAKLGYVGNLSIEAMWDGKDLYVIDFCTRMPITMGYIFPYNFKDYNKFMQEVWEGNAKDFVDTDKYYSIVNIFNFDKKWMLLPIDDGYLTYNARLNGKIYSLPHKDVHVAWSVFGEGEDYLDALDDAIEKVPLNVSILDNKDRFVETFARYRDSIKKLGREDIWWL